MAEQAGTAPDPDELISHALWQAQHVVELALDSALAPLGLSTSLVGTMTFVARQPGLSAADVARLARVKPQSAAHVVNRLVELGMIARSPHPVHGRVMRLHLTDKGRRALDRAAAAEADTERALTAGLSPVARRKLLDNLETIRTAAERLLRPGAT